jgi:hypothetical protein
MPRSKSFWSPFVPPTLQTPLESDSDPKSGAPAGPFSGWHAAFESTAVHFLKDYATVDILPILPF